MRTSRQIRNRQLRDMGIRPTDSYHSKVGPGDIYRRIGQGIQRFGL